MCDKVLKGEIPRRFINILLRWNTHIHTLRRCTVIQDPADPLICRTGVSATQLIIILRRNPFVRVRPLPVVLSGAKMTETSFEGWQGRIGNDKAKIQFYII